jgi:hypothetical protein
MVESFTDKRTIRRILSLVKSPGTLYRADLSNTLDGVRAFERYGSIYTLYLDMTPDIDQVLLATIEPV